MVHQPISLMWFRDDLRVADNSALVSAMDAGPTIAVYLLDEQSPGIRPLGGAAKWWLHHGLADLRKNLAMLGIELILRRGAAARQIPELMELAGASSLHWNRRYGGPERSVDSVVMERVRAAGAAVHSHAGFLLHEPWVPVTQESKPYRVFTPFYNALQRLPLREPVPKPEPQQPLGSLGLHSDALTDWSLLPSRPDWAQGLAAAWNPGEDHAQERLKLVLDEIAGDYLDGRDRPDIDGTSRLSAALRWGHLSPGQVWRALSMTISKHPQRATGAQSIMRQLAWRDFCWNLLYHQPDLATTNLRPEYDDFDWSWPQDSASGEDHDDLIRQYFIAWSTGETGYGMVDAGMKQLWDTGWMHNRVRMVTASFLIKNLGIHWRVGEEWFWDTLVDADAASNPANWQWVAGCGADASPFFRVFNPELQAKKFDPRGTYVTRFAPLSAAQPIVDLKSSRAAALASYAEMKDRGAAPER